MQGIQFDYFRGMEAEQYSFYRIPKMLFTVECFRGLSCEAKVLYGLMLDRMGLSIKNRWFDEEDRVYIVFTVEEIAEMMDCGTQKAVKLVKELDADKGIGLIEKKRLGLGKPNVIYVKNFMTVNEEPRLPEGRETRSDDSRVVETVKRELSQFKNSENHNSGVVKATIQECSESRFKNGENHNSGMVKTTIQEFPKSQSNNTEFNKTDFSETDPINPYPSDVIGQMDRYRSLIRENILYECFLSDTSCQREELDELVELMVDVMVMPDHASLRIAGVERPAIVVRERFLKLEHSHIAYVLGCLRSNTSKVGNIRSYLLTSLYNAALTIDNYYRAEVNHDLYGTG
ncbi:MAG: replication initiator protein A [Lachnospiraceae bacterium]|nr:replication initiator protein A [Lachnospiraceae bacterium]